MKKSTWIILGLAAVLGLAYVVTKPNKISVGVKRLELPSFDLSQVDHISIKNKEALSLSKDQGIWYIKTGTDENPQRVKADEAAVKSMLEAAANLSHSHYVTELAEKLPDLGLVGDSLTTISLSAGDKILWSLLLGKFDEEGGRYAKLADQPQVYVVRGSFGQLTKTHKDELRDHNIWNIPESELLSLEIIRDTMPSIVLNRAENGQDWVLDKKTAGLLESFRTDQAALQNLVRASLKLQANGFIDEKKELGAPIARLNLKTKDEKKHELQVFSPLGPNYVVKNLAEEQIFTISKSSLDRILKPVSELRDFSLMKFEKPEIIKLTLASKKGRIILEKSENQWQIKEPKQLPKDFEFDASAVDHILNVMTELKGDRLAILSKDKATNPTWKNQPLVELNTADKKIDFFATKSKTNPKEYLAQGNIDQEIYIIPSASVRLLERGLDAFNKEEFKLPPIDENTKGFESLPIDIQRKLLDATKGQR